VAALLAKQGRIGEAITHYREALRIRPDDVSALGNMAWLRATCPEPAFRDGVEAVQLAEHAARLTNGREPEILDVLAAAYAEAGRYPKAVQAARTAFELAKQQHQQMLAKTLQTRLRLYEVGSPYRQPSPVATEGHPR
jgi:tetratricopeptide (TPR) repeat protein